MRVMVVITNPQSDQFTHNHVVIYGLEVFSLKIKKSRF
jgi:hypothetical protein